MIYYCEKCSGMLRGERVWDDYAKAICHTEFYCRNVECSEFEIRVDPKTEIQKLKSENIELKTRLTKIEKELGL